MICVVTNFLVEIKSLGISKKLKRKEVRSLKFKNYIGCKATDSNTEKIDYFTHFKFYCVFVIFLDFYDLELYLI